MSIRLTLLARETIEQYKLPVVWIAATITDPDHARPDPGNPAFIRAVRAIPEARGKWLWVDYWQDGDDTVIIAARFKRKPSGLRRKPDKPQACPDQRFSTSSD